MATEDYGYWLAHTDGELHKELKSIQGNAAEIEKRFAASMTFGTSGLRGILGAGTSRMNIHTVGLATQAFADVLSAKQERNQVVIAYDSRINSELFAQTAACIFAANGIRVWLFDRLMPTPTLSFAVRRLGCDAGVIITASHNPAEYNGYKAYGADGGQLTPDKADKIGERMAELDCFTDVRKITLEKGTEQGLICPVPQQVVEDYLAAVSALSLSNDREANARLKGIYTPLNGTGLECVRRIFAEKGFDGIAVAQEQAEPNGNFPTCPYPNPEFRGAMELGIQLCKEQGADLLVANDPDSDRLGVWSADGSAEGRLLGGNEIGALLLEYICRIRTAQGTMPQNPIVVKSVVSSELADRIAARFGVKMVSVLTGFKYTGQVLSRLESEGREADFLFGFEESHGYLSGSHVRDKDGINAALLICELAAQLKKEGKTLAVHLEELYREYGWLSDRAVSKAFGGTQSMAEMNAAMDRLRKNPPTKLGGLAVTAWADFLIGQERTASGAVTALETEKTNMLRWRLGENGWVIIRPSGTEPKMKIYLNIGGEDRKTAGELAESIACQLLECL